MRTRVFLFYLLIPMLLTPKAFALVLCTTVGTQAYDFTNHVLQFCEYAGAAPTTVPGSIISSCTAAEEGRIERIGNGIRFCDKTNWRSIVRPSCATPITTPIGCGVATPIIRFTASGRLISCQDGKWYISLGTCTPSFYCPEYDDATQCTAAGCTWAAGKCDVTITGCASYNNAPACNGDPNCGWVGNSCADAF